MFLSCRHLASFLSMLKFAVIILVIVGKDPFTLFGIPTPGVWTWGQENKVKDQFIFFYSLAFKYDRVVLGVGLHVSSVCDVSK